MIDINQIIVTFITTIGTIVTGWLGYKASVHAKKQTKSNNENNEVTVINRWKTIWLVTFLCFGAATVVAYFIYFNKDLVKDKKIIAANKQLVQLINKGISDSKEYVIPTISMNVTLDSVGDHLEADISLVYNVLQIDTPKRTDKTFDDFYRLTRKGAEIIDLSGSDTISENPSGWNFQYTTEPGVCRTTSSHFKVKYPNSLATWKPLFFDSLTAHQEVFDYNNGAKDIIGEVLIVVSSSTLDFQKSSQTDAAYGLPNKKPEYILPFFSKTKESHSTIVARYNALLPEQHAQLKVQWK